MVPMGCHTFDIEKAGGKKEMVSPTVHVQNSVSI